MPARIPDDIRDEVIRDRILGEPIDKIAADLGISHGAVVGIEKEWRTAFGNAKAEAILSFTKVLKKLKITHEQCLQGAQVFAILSELGIKIEDVKRILPRLLEEVVDLGITPSETAKLLMQLLDLSSKFSVPLQEVPDVLSTEETRLGDIKRQISELVEERKKTQKELQDILDEAGMTKENLCKCVEAENKLKKLGLSFSKVDQVANVIQKTDTLDSDPAKIASTFASMDSLQKQKDELGAQLKLNERKTLEAKEKLEAITAELAKLENLKKLLDKFVDLGFNEHMLKKLLHVIEQVAKDRTIPIHTAAGILLADIETDYNSVLGFRLTLEQLEHNLKDVQAKLLEKQTEHVEFKDAIDSWQFLNSKGIREKDLLYWHKVFRDYPKLSPDMLTECLRSYADLKEAIISMETKLGTSRAELEKLGSEIELKQKEKANVIEEAEKKVKQAESRLEELQKQEKELLIKMARDVLEESTKKALLEGIMMRSTKSLLLPIIAWELEGKGDLPKPEEIYAATTFMIGLLRRYIEPSDPMKTDVDNIEASLRLKLGMSGTVGGTAASGDKGSTGGIGS